MASIWKLYKPNILFRSTNLQKIFARKKRTLSPATSEHNVNTGSSVLIEKDNHITLIGLNRANNRNSIDQETARSLGEAIFKFETDKTSPVAVIYGVGGSFSTGQDLAELEMRCQNNDFHLEYNALRDQNFVCRHSKKPIICGINGYCIADGLELAMLCDLRVMEDTAILGFFSRSIGLNLRCGGTARLPALIGYSQSLDLLLTGRRVGGQEALKIGLVNRLVATGTALGQAVNLAFSIAKFPLEALQQDRGNLYINCYERRNGFDAAKRRESASINSNTLKEMKDGVNRFKSSTSKGPKTDSWQVKPKPIPDWEQTEIRHEKRFALNMSAIENKF